jgi:pimeloyl-ACP methyl ester carboxylesterase
LNAAVAGVRPDVLAHRLATVLRLKPLDRLDRISIPVLYLRATHDRLVPAAAAQVLAERIRQVRRVDIDAPHARLQVAPEAAAEAVREFLKSVPAA